MRSQIGDFLHTHNQDNPGTEFMGSPNASASSDTDPMDSENKPLTVDDVITDWMSDTLSDRILLWGSIPHVRYLWDREYLDWEYESYQQTSKFLLNEIRHEAEEACTLDNEIGQIPETAYDDALVLLRRIFRSGIPMPELSWAEDGSLSFTWFPGEGIATMGIYGDNIVIYTAFFEEKRQIEGICELSDTPMLSGFLTTLSNILFK